MHKNLLETRKDESNQKNKLVFTLPENWWNVSYSYNFYSEEDNSQVQLFKMALTGTEKNEKELKAEKQQIARKWDYSKGDYFIHESNFKNKAYQQKTNNKIFDKFLYIGLTASVIISLIILSLISKM